MLRKLTYLVLASLAGLVILVHEVIPHHHHGNHVCFGLGQDWLRLDGEFDHQHDGFCCPCGHVSADNHRHDKGCCEQGHALDGDHEQHDDCYAQSHVPAENQSENGCHDPCDNDPEHRCLLSELLVFHPQYKRHEISCQEVETGFRPHFQPEAAHFSGYEPLLTAPGGIPFRQKPFYVRYKTTSAALIPGLRAPPSIV